jgi:DNA-binding response OmpR family regulator
MAAGFDDYWTKPIDVHRVLADLLRLLAQHARPHQ